MPLAPYALAFLYVHTQPGTTERVVPVVTAATRLWHAAPESEHPIPLITTFTNTIRDVLSPPPSDAAGHNPAGADEDKIWDPRTELAIRRDEMPADAAYFGLGFSTLDTAAASFADFCHSARTGHPADSDKIGIPGDFCFVANPSADINNADHRVFSAQRLASRDHDTVTIHSYGAFSGPQILTPYPYSPVGLEDLYQRSPHARVLQAMWRLDQALRAADITAANRRAQSATPQNQRAGSADRPGRPTGRRGQR
ncbi:hypothetical protein Ato02nite_061930 [Paractinoplanes toevensis]|uniref:Uncharacterized protein n=2 Tax=Paractinoplanes toevensis TaxID=571911 RepID=A0A919W6C5_9ACTN|nr:hypothetical protein Ato02nite_061930 [Actinoplanes toevensis]